MIQKNNFIIRLVDKKDSKRVWEIRNHREFRKKFGNTETILFESHHSWFEKKYFGDEDNFCFVLENKENGVIGYCRFNSDETNRYYIVSIALMPGNLGKGLGYRLLNGSLQKLVLKEKDILATIKKNNTSSIKLFQNRQFKIYKEDENNYYLKYKPHKTLELQTPRGIRKIGHGYPVFIIAELSANHSQDFEKAIKMIDAACDAGVDAIKLQTYTPDTMTIDSNKDYFQIKVNDTWAGQTLYNLYKKAYTPWEWQPKLKEYAEKKGVLLFSTPFDDTAVDFLEKMNVELYKVASFEVVDIPLLKRIGQTKKPVIMSRGMSSVEEIELAIKVLKDNGCPNLILLHCVSSYPAKSEEMNLSTIPDMVKRFDIPIGLSDHTLGINVSIASVVLGACVVEKHFTLSRDDGGPDATFSLEPHEFKHLVKSIREAELAIGVPSYGAGEKESENVVFRRSLFITKDIKKGERFTAENVRSIRPGHGLKPKYLDKILSKIAKYDVDRGTPLTWDLIEN